MSYNFQENCNYCQYNNQHSFHKLNEDNAAVYFYTCHSKTKSYDGFIDHMIIELLKVKNKKWIWIFDSLLFGLKHFINKTFGIQLLDFLNNYIHIELDQIIIINQTISFRMLLTSIWYCLPKHIKDKIIFDKNNMFSSLLQIDDKLSNLEDRLFNESY
jgi:hypothetical protein